MIHDPASEMQVHLSKRQKTLQQLQSICERVSSYFQRRGTRTPAEDAVDAGERAETPSHTPSS